MKNKTVAYKVFNGLCHNQVFPCVYTHSANASVISVNYFYSKFEPDRRKPSLLNHYLDKVVRQRWWILHPCSKTKQSWLVFRKLKLRLWALKTSEECFRDEFLMTARQLFRNFPSICGFADETGGRYYKHRPYSYLERSCLEPFVHKILTHSIFPCLMSVSPTRF